MYNRKTINQGLMEFWLLLIIIFLAVFFTGCSGTREQPSPRYYNSVEGRAAEMEGSYYKGRLVSNNPEGQMVEGLAEATVTTATESYGKRLYGECKVKFKGDPFGVTCRNVVLLVKDPHGDVIKKTQTNPEGRIEVTVPDSKIYKLEPANGRFALDPTGINEFRVGQDTELLLVEN